MLVRAVRETFERRALPTTDIGWRNFFRGVGSIYTTPAGEDVTEDAALNLATVWACVSLLAGSIAKLPLCLYQEDKNGRKRKAIDHPLYPLLHRKPNSRQTIFEFLRFTVTSIALRGNALSFVEKSHGKVIGIWPLHWNAIEPKADGASIQFIYRPQTGESMTFRASECWYVYGESTDGVIGCSPIAMARESFGLGLALQRYGSRYFGNGARPSGVLQTDKQLGPDAQSRLAESWQSAHGGANSHRVAVLEDGLKYQQIGLAPEDSQFLESRKFSREEIAQWFRVPPSLIGVQATHNNSENESQNFVTHHLTDRLSNIEKSLERDLLTEEECAAGYYLKFNTGALLRGDIKTRSDAHRSGILTGWLTRNEARMLEDLNPLEGLDEPLSPLNMASGADPGADADSDTEIPTMDETQRMRRALAPVIADAAARVARAEEREVRKARDIDSALALYADGSDLRALIERTVAPVLRGVARELEPWIAAHVEATVAELRHCGAEKTLERWRTTRAAEIATGLSEQVGAPAPQQPIVREIPPRRIVRDVVRDEAGRIARIIDQEV